jgi:iron(III) transport system ATP-binding protein
VSLEVEGLEKRFGETAVVRGLSLSIGAGEIVSLLGPSGCGKTTALRMIAGLETPDAGRIRIEDRVVLDRGVDVAPERRRIGMVFQSYAVWPHRSVRENVAYPLQVAKDADALRKADDALALVHLEGMGDRAPGTLSGGQQQRVALARALVARPSLLLFDEPLSNLDAKLREDMRHEIRQLAKGSGITSVYVTHDRAEAFSVSDRVAVILDGRVAQIDVPAAIYAEPRDLRTARFLGRLSLLEGAVRTGDREVTIGGCAIPATFGDPGPQKLAVRPESVEIGEEGIEGTVLRSTFLGERVEVVVETAFGEIRADAPARGAPAPGETVRVRIAEGRMLA